MVGKLCLSKHTGSNPVTRASAPYWTHVPREAGHPRPQPARAPPSRGQHTSFQVLNRLNNSICVTETLSPLCDISFILCCRTISPFDRRPRGPGGPVTSATRVQGSDPRGAEPTSQLATSTFLSCSFIAFGFVFPKRAMSHFAEGEANFPKDTGAVRDGGRNVTALEVHEAPGSNPSSASNELCDPGRATRLSERRCPPGEQRCPDAELSHPGDGPGPREPAAARRGKHKEMHGMSVAPGASEARGASRHRIQRLHSVCARGAHADTRRHAHARTAALPAHRPTCPGAAKPQTRSAPGLEPRVSLN